MTNQYLDELAQAHGGAGPTPEELAALNHIAALRAQGMTDQQIFGQAAGGDTQTVGGGYGYLPYVLQAAGINSSYDLGRGNIALNAQEDYYKRQSNPFEIVGALQQQRDLGTSGGDAVIRNITPSATPYQGYLNSLLAAPAGAGSATGGGAPPPSAGAGAGLDAATIARGAKAGLDPETIRRIQEAYARDPHTANLFFSMGNPNVSTQSPYTSSVLGTATTPGGESVTPIGGRTGIPGGEAGIPIGGGISTIQPTAGPSPIGGGGSAQEAGARLVGGAVGRYGFATPQFQKTLQGGKVAGFGSINEADMAKLTPDQRAAYFGVVGSTGAFSDPAAAYADYAKKYSQGGLGGGGSYR